jgi:glycosyltransferase involved in cell wall biosynthesis
MKILISSLPDLNKINLQRPHYIVKWLSKKHEVTIISGNANILKPVCDPLVEECLKNIDYHYLSYTPTNSLFHEFQILKIMRKISDGKDPFDLHLNFHSILSCYLLQKKYSIPTVMDICDDIIGWIAHSPQITPIIRPVAASVSRHLLLTNIKKSDKIIFSVKSLQDLYGIPQNKSVIIPNGVDVDFFTPNSSIINSSHHKDPYEFSIGFVGFLGDWVDFRPVFAAISQLRNTQNVRILIIGDGPYLDNVRDLATEFSLSNVTFFSGNVPYREIPNYISEMDVCLLPFNYSSISQHALPLKLFEYMAGKKPVISSRLNAVEKTIGNRILYYSNSNELKIQLKRLYTNKKLREGMSNAGFKFVQDNYSWDSIVTTYEKVLMDVLNQRKL